MNSMACDFVTVDVTPDYPQKVTTKTEPDQVLTTDFPGRLPGLPFSDGHLP